MDFEGSCRLLLLNLPKKRGIGFGMFWPTWALPLCFEPFLVRFPIDTTGLVGAKLQDDDGYGASESTCDSLYNTTGEASSNNMG